MVDEKDGEKGAFIHQIKHFYFYIVYAVNPQL